MALTERERRNLYEQAEAAMGREAADTLMAHLPPVGWADVATKQDLRQELAVVKADLQVEIRDLRAEFHDTLRQELGRMTDSINRRFRWLFTAVGVLVAIAADIGRLF